MKFRVLEGKHQVFTDIDGVIKVDIYNGETPDRPGKPSRPGEVLETDIDLAEKFNHPPKSLKFERVPDDTPTKEEMEALKDKEKVEQTPQEEDDDAFSEMTVAELKEVALQDGVDLEGVTKKEDILKALRLHVAGV